jgi:drug/metabolite transporter (DMT)-like permease
LKVPPISYLLLLLPPLLWATMIIVGFLVLEQVPPATLTFWTWLIAAVSLAPFFCMEMKKNLLILKDEFWALFFFGLLGAMTFQYFIFTGLLSASAISASVLTPTIPIMVACLSWPLLKEKLGLLQILGVIVAFIGACWIASAGNLANILVLKPGAGESLILLANLCMAGYTVMLKLYPSKLSAISFMAVVSMFGTAQALPFSLLEVGLVPGFNLVNKLPVQILYIGIVNYSLAYVFWNIAVKSHGASKTAMFLYLIPVFGTLLSVLFLSEQFHTYYLGGIALIFTGLYLSLHYEKH